MNVNKISDNIATASIAIMIISCLIIIIVMPIKWTTSNIETEKTLSTVLSVAFWTIVGSFVLMGTATLVKNKTDPL